MPKHLAPATLQHSHKHKIYFSIFLCLFFFLPLSLFLTHHRLYARYICNDHKEQNQKIKLCVPTGRSPLQCPWVLSISGKEARLSADCRGCCVRFSRPHPRSGRSVCPSIVICYRTTRYSRTNRRCYRRRCSPRIFSPCVRISLCSIRCKSLPSLIRVPRAGWSSEAPLS